MSDMKPIDDLEPTEGLVSGLASGRTSRDEFIKRAGMLGLSATAIGGMLAAAGKATAGDMHEARRLAGSTVNLLVPAEGAQLGVQEKMAYMKKQFGIDVKMTALPVGPLNEKLSASVKASTGTYDLISVLGFTVSAFVGGGYFTPLAPYIKTLPKSYGYPSDFAQGELDYLSNYNIKTQTFGGNTALPDPGPVRRTDHPLLPQGSSQEGRARRADQLLTHYLAAAKQAEHGRHRRQHDDREVRRRVDVPRRLVLRFEGMGGS